MLLFKRYRCIFNDSCGFLLKVVKFGRKFSPVGAQKLKKLLFNDIKMIPKNILRSLKPLRKMKRRESALTRPGRLSGEGGKSFSPGKLSDVFPNLRLSGLKVCGGSFDSARWFKIIPPNVIVDANFRCDNGVLRKDTFQNPEMFHTYLGLSRTI